MSFFSQSDFDAFADAHARDPEFDADRARVREKLVWLHHRIYPELRERRWDIHAHPLQRWLISPTHVSMHLARVGSLILRYSKPETTIRLMKRELGLDATGWYSNAMLDVRVDARGIAVELFISAPASADAENFKNKLLYGAPQKMALRQLCAELGGAYSWILRHTAAEDDPSSGGEIVRVRCSRLVNLGVLNATLHRFTPGEHDLAIAMRIEPDDPRLNPDLLPGEIIYRLGQLYPLYQFASWSPRNNYLRALRQQSTREQSS
jgi:hypothetical protein